MLMDQKVLIGIGLVWALLGCSQERERDEAGMLCDVRKADATDNFQTFLDLGVELRSQIQQEATLLDFRADAHPESFLLHGWTVPEKRYTWAQGLISRILFYTSNTSADMTATVTCQAMPSIQQQPQVTTVFLNDQAIGTLTPQPLKFAQFPLTLPAQWLHSGRNILEFRFTYATKPNQIDAASKDDRNLAVAFHTLVFQPREPAAHLRPATTEILLNDQLDRAAHLKNGWSQPEADRIWANATQSSLTFDSLGGAADVTLRMMCQAMPAADNAAQQVQVFLNDQAVGDFVAQTEAFQEYIVNLPAVHLRSGQNVLNFHFAYTAQPFRVHSGSKDRRTLAVAFQKIAFDKQQIVSGFDETSLLQRADTNLTKLAALPSEIEVDVTYAAVRQATPTLVFTNERGQSFAIELAQRQTRYQKIVTLKEPGVYRIAVRNAGEAGSYTLWKQLQLRTRPATPPVASAGFTPQRKPDILLYVVDTLRADHTSCYGYARQTTPQLDRFAAENTLFTNAYAAAAWTKASGAVIMTGLLPKNNKTMTKKDRMSDDLVLLSEALQAQGYYTTAFLANGNVGTVFGFQQGYDEFHRFMERRPVTGFVQSDELNQGIFPFLESYTANKERKPLFMLVWTIDPHDPYAPVEAVRQQFDISQYTPIDTDDLELLHKIQMGTIVPTASQQEFMKTRYDQEIYFNDQSFGQLLAKMRALGMYDDAAIIFTSDHGEEFFEHGGVGHGRTLYNEQVRIPFVVKAPHLTPGASSRPVQHVDIYPTLLDLVGGSPPYALDGVSLIEAAERERTLFFEEDFDGNVLTAALDAEKKVIFTQQYHRPPSAARVPSFEMFRADELAEQKNLTATTLADEFRFDELFRFLNQASTLPTARLEAEVPPDVAEHLRDLGYVK